MRSFRIKGGSSALINALVAALKNKIEMKQGYALTALDYKGGKIVIELRCARRRADSESFDAVILALPFTKLRQVKGLERLRLGGEKLKCIRELGMGQNAKIMQGTTSRVWRSPDSGLPAPSNGTFYSDLGFQNLWESSRAQPGDAGILTNYPGRQGRRRPTRSPRSTPSAPTFPKMSPKMAESLDPAAVISWFWSVYPYTLGSYASAKVGTIHHDAGGGGGTRASRPPAICRRAYQQRLSRLHEWWRESGNRAAAALIKVMALQTNELQHARR